MHYKNFLIPIIGIASLLILIFSVALYSNKLINNETQNSEQNVLISQNDSYQQAAYAFSNENQLALDRHELKKESTLKGLQNMGNTCYISSVLQMLFKIFPDDFQQLVNKSRILQLFYKLKQTKYTHIYQLFIYQLQKHMPIVDGDQQDAHQFYLMFLSLIRNQLEIHSGSSYESFAQLFTGALSHRLTCKQHKHSNSRFSQQYFEYLSLSFGQTKQEQIRLPSLINSQFIQQQIDGVYCQICNRNTIFSKQSKIIKFPKYLVLYLSRFAHGQSQFGKIDTILQYDQLIRLSKQEDSLGKFPQYEYQLVGIINHLGTISSGHYTAQLRYSLSDGNKPQLKSEWFQFNDRTVTQIDKFEYGNKSKNVYMLFYQLVSK